MSNLLTRTKLRNPLTIVGADGSRGIVPKSPRMPDAAVKASHSPDDDLWRFHDAGGALIDMPGWNNDRFLKAVDEAVEVLAGADMPTTMQEYRNLWDGVPDLDAYDRVRTEAGWWRVQVNYGYAEQRQYAAMDSDTFIKDDNGNILRVRQGPDDECLTDLLLEEIDEKNGTWKFLEWCKASKGAELKDAQGNPVSWQALFVENLGHSLVSLKEELDSYQLSENINEEWLEKTMRELGPLVAT